jgi:hypothetical protein
MLTKQSQYASAGGEAVFARIYANPLAMMWVSTIFAPFCFGNDFELRTIDGTIFAGYGRLKIVAVKTISYFSAVTLISVVSFITSLMVSMRGMPLKIDFMFLVEKITFFIVVTWGIFSAPLLFTFLFRNIFGSISSSVAFTYFMIQAISYSGESPLAYTIAEYYPGYIQMLQGSPSGHILYALLIIFAWIIVSILLSVLIMKKAELK